VPSRAALVALALASCSRSRAPTVWHIDDTKSLGGHAVTAWGAPKVIDTERGRAVCFDGTGDGLLLDVNPLQGLTEFTVEVLFRPDRDGAPEQRFVHFSEEGGDNRGLLETRLLPGGTWYLDTFLRKGEAELPLRVQEAQHPADAWYWAALTYRDGRMSHFVNGSEEASGTLSFAALGSGRLSLGVRQNQVSWFKGCLRELRISPIALAPDELQHVRPGR